MNLPSKILAAGLLVAIHCFAGAAGAAPIGAIPHDPAAAVQTVDWRGGHWSGGWHSGGRGWGWGPGAGFAAGAIVGGALASPYGYGYDYSYDPGYSTYGYSNYGYAPGYSTYGYDPGYYDYGYSAPGGYVTVAPGRDAAYCQQRFRSYDPASGTYLGFDGLRHPCP
jgi:hypothetical protein